MLVVVVLSVWGGVTLWFLLVVAWALVCLVVLYSLFAGVALGINLP